MQPLILNNEPEYSTKNKRYYSVKLAYPFKIITAKSASCSANGNIYWKIE